MTPTTKGRSRQAVYDSENKRRSRKNKCQRHLARFFRPTFSATSHLLVLNKNVKRSANAIFSVQTVTTTSSWPGPWNRPGIPGLAATFWCRPTRRFSPRRGINSFLSDSAATADLCVRRSPGQIDRKSGALTVTHGRSLLTHTYTYICVHIETENGDDKMAVVYKTTKTSRVSRYSDAAAA